MKIIKFFMMISKLCSKINQTLSWLINKLQGITSQIRDVSAYEIQEVSFVNGTYKVLVQINGTGKIVSYSPQEIADDEAFLKEFSIKDIRTIYYLNFEELKKPKYAIVGHKFSEKRKIIISLKDRETGKIDDFTASEISINKDILNQCLPLDAHRIGYIHGTEKLQKDE